MKRIISLISMATAAQPMPALSLNEESEEKSIIATRTIRAGETLDRSLLTYAEGGTITEIEIVEIIGQEAKKTMYAGTPVTKADIGPRTVITRNALIVLEFEKGPLLMTTAGRALDSGASGDVIRVMNTESKRVLSATITGENKARTQ
ncbi:MAG: flagellar basal body P-ring formation chaperone FlgA [Pseudomonadota bacterium]